MPKKILITGASGQLGRKLNEILSIHFPLILTAKTMSNGNKIHAMDITNREAISDIIYKFNPNIIINCAAVTNVDLCEDDHSLAHKVNCEGMSNILNVTSKDTKIIQISSDYIFDGYKPPYKETDLPYPINYYGKTKLEAENILRGSNHPYLILRASVLFDYSNNNISFFTWAFNKLSQGEKINVVTDQKSNPSYNHYFAETILRSIIMNVTGIYNYGSEDSISRYEFALKIAKVFELDPTLISPIKTSSFPFTAVRPEDSTLSTDKIEQELKVDIKTIDFALQSIRSKMAIA